MIYQNQGYIKSILLAMFFVLFTLISSLILLVSTHNFILPLIEVALAAWVGKRNIHWLKQQSLEITDTKMMFHNRDEREILYENIESICIRLVEPIDKVKSGNPYGSSLTVQEKDGTETMLQYRDYRACYHILIHKVLVVNPNVEHDALVELSQEEFEETLRQILIGKVPPQPLLVYEPD